MQVEVECQPVHERESPAESLALRCALCLSEAKWMFYSKRSGQVSTPSSVVHLVIEATHRAGS